MKYLAPPLQALLWGVIAYYLSQSFSTLTFATATSWVFIGGFIGAGLVIDVLALAQMIKARTSINPIQLNGTRILLTTGVYSFSRNPMYLGMLCYLIALTYALANPMAAIAPIGFVLMLNQTQIKREERWMREQFGEDYEEYSATVRRWFGSKRT